MTKSSFKHIFINKKLLNLLDIIDKKGLSSKEIYTRSRSSTINELMLNNKFYVHNGKSYNYVPVNSNMLGYKLGEFCFTRKVCSFKKKKKQKKNFKTK